MTLISGIFSRTYMPMCRAYARYMLGDKPADLVMRFLCSLYFWKVHQYWPHFRSPHSFAEKVWHRMLYDRDHIWAMISDKLRVRDYVESKVGSEYLVPLLWSGENPAEIPFAKLPQKFVIKTTHGCKYNILVKDKMQLDQMGTKRQLKKWLSENYCQDHFLGIEWGYKDIKPSIIVELFLEVNGNAPVDYKFFCYSGRAEFIQIDFDRFRDHSEKFVDRYFNLLDFELGLKQYRGEVQRPDLYEYMIQVAESLAKGFDFIRVDLYSVGGRIYIGELTVYPSGGCSRFTPKKYDFLFGEKWKMK